MKEREPGLTFAEKNRRWREEIERGKVLYLPHFPIPSRESSEAPLALPNQVAYLRVLTAFYQDRKRPGYTNFEEDPTYFWYSGLHEDVRLENIVGHPINRYFDVCYGRSPEGDILQWVQGHTSFANQEFMYQGEKVFGTLPAIPCPPATEFDKQLGLFLANSARNPIERKIWKKSISCAYWDAAWLHEYPIGGEMFMVDNLYYTGMHTGNRFSVELEIFQGDFLSSLSLDTTPASIGKLPKGLPAFSDKWTRSVMQKGSEHLYSLLAFWKETVDFVSSVSKPE